MRKLSTLVSKWHFLEEAIYFIWEYFNRGNEIEIEKHTHTLFGESELSSSAKARGWAGCHTLGDEVKA